MKNSRLPHLPAAPPASRRSLVIARDFPTLCTLREIMAAADFEVHCAAAAVEVWRLLARYRYDAVIADLDFGTADPGPTLAILARARQKNPTSRLVVVTSAADSAERADFARLAAEICRAVRGDVASLRDELDTIVRRPDTARSSVQEGQLC
jgi:DNA-binding NarL/FixJ family response regulator